MLRPDEHSTRPLRRRSDPAGSSPTGGAAGPVPPTTRSTSATTSATTRPTSRPTAPGSPRELGVPEDRLVWMNQVHGTGVAVVDGPQDGPVPATDALVTATPGLVLCVLVADCVPVLLADPVAGVVAAVHAGREGVRRGVVPGRAVGHGEPRRPARHVTALLGPAVCGACYEVPEADAGRGGRASRRPPRCAPAAGPPGWTCGPGSTRSCAGPASPRSCTTRAAPSRTRTCSPTAATASPAARPGSSGSADPELSDADRREPTSRRTCARSARGSTPRPAPPGATRRRSRCWR